MIIFVTDSANDWSSRGAHRADEPFVAEGQQVFETAPAAGEDDHIDEGVSIEGFQRRHHLGDRVYTLHRHLNGVKINAWPPLGRVGHDVVQGGASPPADESDAPGKKGQLSFAFSGEEALGLE